MQQSAETADKAVCTDDGSGGEADGGGGAARLELVLSSLVERKSVAMRRERARRQANKLGNHPLLLLLRALRNKPLQLPAAGSQTSLAGTPAEVLPQHWCEHESPRGKHKMLQLQGVVEEELEMERRRRRRRRRRRQRAAALAQAAGSRRPRTLLVSAIDEQAKVIHVLDPDELPRRARWTIMVTACLLLFLCLLLVGVTLRMAPLIDDMGFLTSKKFNEHNPGTVPGAPGSGTTTRTDRSLDSTTPGTPRRTRPSWL